METRVLISRRSTTARAIAATLVALATSAPTQARADAQVAMTDEARKLYDEGKAARDAGDPAACVAKLRAAWALKKHRQVAGLLGECELESGSRLEAAEHLAYFLDRSADVSPDVVSQVRKLYDQARESIAVVAVKSTTAGADRRVDGRLLAPDELRVFLPPGEHVFAASKPGEGAAERRETLSAGQESEVVLELVRETAAPPVSTPPPAERPDGPSIVPGLVIGGVGLAGIGVGVGLIAASSGPGSDAEQIAAALRADGAICEPDPTAGFEARCAAFQQAADDETTLATPGVAALIAGGVLLTGGVVWTVWAATAEPDPDGDAAARHPTPRATLTLQPMLGPTSGVVVGGTFF